MNDYKLYQKRYDGLQSFGRYQLQSRAGANGQSNEIQDEIGIGSIFGLPFRMYGDERLSMLIGEVGGSRYQVYPPVSVNYPGAHNPASLSTNVPFEQWPSFEWSTVVSPEDHKRPSFNLGQIPHQSVKAYNGVRIDVWGPDCQKRMKLFSHNFFEWLRVLSGQTWINSYESHYDSSLKYQFGIDELGRAVDQPIALLDFTIQNFSSLTDNIWKEAFSKAINAESVPIYLTVLHDAYNSYARQNLWECVLYLALSVEIARNIHFQRFCIYTVKKGVTKFEEPFNDTDLLKLLSVHLEKKIGRNLEKEDNSLWSQFKRMYVTRHLIAHGKPELYQSGSGLKPLTDPVVIEWLKSTPQLIQWIEKL